jgi:HSP20 family protein
MALVRWDPFEEMAVLRGQMERLMGRAGREGSWMPAVDVIDGQDALTIKAELPGMDPDQISLHCDEDSLTLSGERRSEERTEEEGRLVSLERRFGRFERSFPLPRNAETDRIEANYQNGVLEVRVPKAAAAEPRRIEVRQGAAKGTTQSTERAA